MNNAIKEFGFDPRDVYAGVFNLPATKDKHKIAIDKMSYADLTSLAAKFSKSFELDSASHQVIAVDPAPFLLDRDKWNIGFKSDRIAETAKEAWRNEKLTYLRTIFDDFRQNPESSSLAGCVFESMGHRMFSKGWQESHGALPQPFPMTSDRCDPPIFSVDFSTSDTSPSSPLHAGARNVVPVDFTYDLREVTLDNDKYYVPTTQNNPLFDSFTIDSDPDRRAAVVSVFQFTISDDHGGSSKGYPLVRKIVKRVSNLLGKGKGKPKPTVKVKYFLVCPEGKPTHKWRMPPGWDKTFKQSDHRGEAFCIRVPLSGFR